MIPFPMGELEWTYELDRLTRERAEPILGHMARPPKVTAASMRTAQNQKTALWNAELTKVVVGASTAALIAKLESALQIALESPRPRDFVQVAHRFEVFNEPRTVLNEVFLTGQLLDEMRNLMLAQVDAAFDRGRNFTLEFSIHQDGMGCGVKMTWSKN